MNFVATILYNKSATVVCRTFDAATGMWWTGAAWSATEASAATTALTELTITDASYNRYHGSLTIPDGSYLIEYLEGSDIIQVENVSSSPNAIEGSLTLESVMRLILAFIAGKSNGGGTTTHNFRDQADTKNRISATVDALGNRTATSVDGT